MNIVVIGGAGFIGTNLAIKLSENLENKILLVDRNLNFFNDAVKIGNVQLRQSMLNCEDDFAFLDGQDVLYHLVSTTVPTTSNQNISLELQENVVFSSMLLEKCVCYGVKKVVFISSGGTVYGKEVNCPLSEETPLKPISSYGMQKVAIENLLYLYYYICGLDYRVIRLSNPYGPYQRPNGILGAVTTFVFKALNKDEIQVYGDGTIIRDFIYIDDAVRGILNIVNGECEKRVFNLGCGYGTSIKEVIEIVKKIVGDVKVIYKERRKVDVPINYLNIARYENYFGKLNPVSLEDGIRKTVEFMRENYSF